MQICFVLLLVILETTCALPVPLPEDIKPQTYDLHIKIDTSGTYSYSGRVIIEILCTKQTNIIALHASQELAQSITEESIQVYQQKVEAYNEIPSKIKIETNGLLPNAENEILLIVLKEFLTVKLRYTVEIPFSGKVSNSLPGWSIVNTDGKYFVASNFKRTYARFVFPCFDDPAFRSKFTVTIERKRDAVSFSNTDLKRTLESKDGWQFDVFEKTNLLSPYQLALVVTDIRLQHHTSTNTYNTVTFWAQESYQGSLVEESKVINNLVKSFTNSMMPKGGKTGMRLRKLDYILVPGSTEIKFETLGLVLVSEDDYVDSEMYGKDHKQQFVAESVIRQWFFSNLSPARWDSQWLLPCLAKLYSLKPLSEGVVQKIYFKEKLIPYMTSVMKSDSQIETKSIHDVIGPSGRIQQEDSPEKLEKGLILLQMMESTFSADIFHSTVRLFITVNQFLQFKESEEFWAYFDHFGEYTKSSLFGLKQKTQESIPNHISCELIMYSWVYQEGYPIITVERSGTNVKVSQKRFFHGTYPEEYCWWIPLTYTTDADPKGFENTAPMQWLGCDDDKCLPSFTVENVKEDQWIIFNNQMTGLYRVKYDDKNWGLILKTLRNPKKFRNIHLFNRAQLVNDALTLSYMKELDFRTAFDVALYLENEDDPNGFVVWASFFSSFERFQQTLKGSMEINELLKKFLKVILARTYKKTFPSKSKVMDYITKGGEWEHFATKLRIHEESCRSKIPECLTHSREIFNEWKSASFSVKPKANQFSKGLALSVICSTLNEAKGVEEIKVIFDALKNTAGRGIDRKLLIEAMKCPGNFATVQKILNWCTSRTSNEKEGTLFDERFTVFKALLGESDTMLEAGTFLYKNFETINRFFSNWKEPTGKYPIYNLVQTMACEINPDQMLEVYKLNQSTNIKIREILNTEGYNECKGFQRDFQWVKNNAGTLKEALGNILKSSH